MALFLTTQHFFYDDKVKQLRKFTCTIEKKRMKFSLNSTTFIEVAERLEILKKDWKMSLSLHRHFQRKFHHRIRFESIMIFLGHYRDKLLRNKMASGLRKQWYFLKALNNYFCVVVSITPSVEQTNWMMRHY